MAKKNKDGLAGDLFDLAAMLPWWAGVVMAIMAYVVLHRFAVAEIATNVPLAEMGHVVVRKMIQSVAVFAQYLVPLLFLAGAAVSALGRGTASQMAAASAASFLPRLPESR